MENRKHYELLHYLGPNKTFRVIYYDSYVQQTNFSENVFIRMKEHLSK